MVTLEAEKELLKTREISQGSKKFPSVSNEQRGRESAELVVMGGIAILQQNIGNSSSLVDRNRLLWSLTE